MKATNRLMGIKLEFWHNLLQKRNRQVGRQFGESFIGILISLGIVSFAIVASYALLSRSRSTLELAREQTIANQFLSGQVETLKHQIVTKDLAFFNNSIINGGGQFCFRTETGATKQVSILKKPLQTGEVCDSDRIDLPSIDMDITYKDNLFALTTSWKSRVSAETKTESIYYRAHPNIATIKPSLNVTIKSNGSGGYQLTINTGTSNTIYQATGGYSGKTKTNCEHNTQWDDKGNSTTIDIAKLDKPTYICIKVGKPGNEVFKKIIVDEDGNIVDAIKPKPTISISRSKKDITATITETGGLNIDESSWGYFVTTNKTKPNCDKNGSYSKTGWKTTPTTTVATKTIYTHQNSYWICFKVSNQGNTKGVYGSYQIDLDAPVVTITKEGENLIASATNYSGNLVWERLRNNSTPPTDPGDCEDVNGYYTPRRFPNRITGITGSKYYCFKVTDGNNKTGYGKYPPTTP